MTKLVALKILSWMTAVMVICLFPVLSFSASLNYGNGEHTQPFRLFSLPSSMGGGEFVLVYHSLDYYNGPAGPKWRHPFTIYLKNRLAEKGVSPSFFFEKPSRNDGRDSYVFPFEKDKFESWRQNAKIMVTTDKGYLVTIDSVKYLFDPKLRLTTVTDPDRNLTLSFNYDVNLVTSVADSTGNMVRFHYSGDHIDKIISPNNEPISLSYDDDGNLAAITYPDNSSFKFTYNKFNLMETKADRQGKILRYEYDDSARVLRSIDASGKTITVDYEQRGTNNIKRTYKDRDGNLTEFYRQFTNNTMFTRSVDSKGNISEVTNDSRTGNPITETDSTGMRTDYKYDDKGKLLEASRSDGKRRMITYDDKGRVVAEHAFDGTDIKYQY